MSNKYRFVNLFLKVPKMGQVPQRIDYKYPWLLLYSLTDQYAGIWLTIFKLYDGRSDNNLTVLIGEKVN